MAERTQRCVEVESNEIVVSVTVKQSERSVVQSLGVRFPAISRQGAAGRRGRTADMLNKQR